MRFNEVPHTIPWWIHFVAGLPPTDRNVFKTAGLCTKADLNFFGSVKTLAQLTSYNPRTVERCLDRLEMAGWLIRVGGGREEGKAVNYHFGKGWAYEVGPAPAYLAVPSDKYLYPLHPESHLSPENSIESCSGLKPEGSGFKPDGSGTEPDKYLLKTNQIQKKLVNVPRNPIENRPHEVGREV